MKDRKRSTTSSSTKKNVLKLAIHFAAAAAASSTVLGVNHSSGGADDAINNVADTVVVVDESQTQQQTQQQHLRHVGRSLNQKEKDGVLKIPTTPVVLRELEQQHTQEYLDKKDKYGTCFFPNLDKTHQLAFEYEKYPDKYDALPKPIINLGMPKCGSTSLYSFFACGGLKTSHYFCGDENGKEESSCGTCMNEASKQGLPVLQSCGNYDALTQIDAEGIGMECLFPQISLLEEFHRDSPYATFILPFRDMDHWVRSLKNWQYQQKNPPMNDILRDCHIDNILPHGIGGRDDELRDFMCQHVTNVRNFVAKYPTHTLIEINIEGSYTGDVLSSLFKINRKCWQNANSNHKSTTDEE